MVEDSAGYCQVAVVADVWTCQVDVTLDKLMDNAG
jgi:hypothetical protein